MIRIIGTISGEGFDCLVREEKTSPGDLGRVFFTADADIDADGANGQRGARVAYRTDDKGSEALINGGMRRVNGRVVFAHDWGRNIVIVENGRPKVFPVGIIASKTALRYPGVSILNPECYVDSETVPYICVPPLIIKGVRPIVMGCQGRITYHGRTVNAVVADAGPLRKIGEISIAAARAVGIPSSPRKGGIDDPEVEYELWPGVPGVVNGETFTLQPA